MTSINYFLCNILFNISGFYITDCSTPPTLVNAAVTYSGTKHDDTASYTCRQPYIKDGTGSGTITCQSGTWTSLDMTCVYGNICSNSQCRAIFSTPYRHDIKWLFYTYQYEKNIFMYLYILVYIEPTNTTVGHILLALNSLVQR